ncbi:hypothetical protein AC578_2682 [Pseudocercospora eumusae]|uniref:F-box domain-containing protein n=1 Tax=Pseudocercospora eumusae TaxID=321146 RepID=A0A139H1A6_9PEZI|nr:hypothetical protein AC578_2682 [Pseudocercospora eumusae]
MSPTAHITQRCSTPAIMTSLPTSNNDSDFDCVQQTTSFYEIPAEIRNEIYELAMPRREEVKLVVASPAWDSIMTTGVQPGITRATRQTRAESLSMFYANNVFEAFIERFDFRQLIHFVRCATSGPKPPKLDIHVKLLNRMTCFRGLLDLAYAWRKLKHQSVHITVHSCLFDGSRSRYQSEIVSEAFNIAERLDVQEPASA